MPSVRIAHGRGDLSSGEKGSTPLLVLISMIRTPHPIQSPVRRGPAVYRAHLKRSLGPFISCLHKKIKSSPCYGPLVLHLWKMCVVMVCGWWECHSEDRHRESIIFSPVFPGVDPPGRPASDHLIQSFSSTALLLSMRRFRRRLPPLSEKMEITPGRKEIVAAPSLPAHQEAFTASRTLLTFSTPW